MGAFDDLVDLTPSQISSMCLRLGRYGEVGVQGLQFVKSRGTRLGALATVILRSEPLAAKMHEHPPELPPAGRVADAAPVC